MAPVKELQHLRIPLQDINLATNYFHKETWKGGFSKVYKAELSHSQGHDLVAIKRLDQTSVVGEQQFLTEIEMLTNYKHDNLISLLGFCDEGGEKILVYEYMPHGSLFEYLRSKSLTWLQRLKICVDAARGLDYLHNRAGEQHRVIHRDLKSSNILLAEDWQAKISDFGLSKIGPANQQVTYLMSKVCGTPGYWDPLYLATGLLTKESDVYSFGVVLLEVLCGRIPLIEDYHDERRSLVQLAQLHIEERRLREIIHPSIEDQIEQNALDTFSRIALRCLQSKREDRPSIDQVLKELEKALDFQESYELHAKWSIDYEEIIKMSDSPAASATKEELHEHLSKGILLDGGKKWLSISEKGKNTEMISAKKFVCGRYAAPTWITVPGSRFPEVAKISKQHGLDIEAQLRTNFLSPGVTYAAYVVFKLYEPRTELVAGEPAYTNLRYRLKDADEFETAWFANWQDDQWMMIELFQFVNYEKNASFQVFLKEMKLINFDLPILLEGIEFLPIEKVEDGGTERFEHGKTNKRDVTVDSDSYWDEKLPRDILQIIQNSKYDLPHITKKDLYIHLSAGILINDNGAKWFWLYGEKKCHMLEAQPMKSLRVAQSERRFLQLKHLPDSRFGHGTKVYPILAGDRGPSHHLEFSFWGSIKTQMMSTMTRYACYLVYKLPKDPSKLRHPWSVKIEVSDKLIGTRVTCLVTPHTPMLGPRSDQRYDKPMNMKVLPKQRKSHWMEVLLWEFIYGVEDITHVSPRTATTTTITSDIPFTITLNFLSKVSEETGSVLVEGVEFRPI